MADQSPEWVDAMCNGGRYRDASRLYEMSDGRRFILPLVGRDVPCLGSRLWSYPPAWGIGGLIGRNIDADVVAAVLDDLRSLNAFTISIRPDPLQGPLWPSRSGDGVHVVSRRAHVIDLSDGLDDVFARLRKSRRRAIRKAEQLGVRIERDTTGRLLDVHYELYLRSVERWAGRQREPLALAQWRARRRDPLSKLRSMAHHLGDRFSVGVAFVDDTPAASAITLLGSAAHDTRGAMDQSLAAPNRANELLQWDCIRHAYEYGARTFHLGESGRSEQLSSYKESFGAQPHDYAEIRLERLPVTRIDTTARTAVKRLIGFRDA